MSVVPEDVMLAAQARFDERRDPAVKTPGFSHQVSIYEEHWNDDPGYCLFWEMGLGKSWEMCAVASRLYLEGLVDAVLYVAPKSVFTNFFTQECPVHMAAPYAGLVYKSRGSGGPIPRIMRKMILEPTNFVGKLRVVCMSYNAVAVTERGFEFAQEFVKKYRTIIFADESTAMQQNSSRTAEAMKSLGRHAARRWIATGTPVASSPHAVHSQIEFVDPKFWMDRGMRSKEAFKRRFGKMRRRTNSMGKSFLRLEGYTNLETLTRMIGSVSSRLLKEDSEVKLPPKLYRTVGFNLHPAQKAVYDALRKAIAHQLDEGVEVDSKMAMVRIMRMQQISCGHVTAIKTGTAGDVGSVELLKQALLRATDESYDEMARMVLQDKLTEDPTRGELWAEAVAEGDFDAGVELARHRALQLQESVKQSDEEQQEMFTADTIAMDAARSIAVESRVSFDIVPREENPRLTVLVELLKEAGIEPRSGVLDDEERDTCAGHKVIVWCRFKRDVSLIAETLTHLGIGHRTYDGATKQDAREEALDLFRDPASDVRVLVANLHAISQGVTLTIAKTAIYYSCTTSLEKRLQSEDRAHRIGQDRNVLIVDIVGNGTADQRLIDGLRKKFDVAARVTGDQLREWISSSPSDEEDD